MPISYKKLFDLLDENGWTTYRIRKEKLIGQGTLTALKNGTGGLDSKTIAKICKVLNCQPGDLMEYIPDWVENRILELTEAREEKLGEYFNDKWSEDDSAEEKLGLYYSEEYIPEEIERLETNEEIDSDYAKILCNVCFKFPASVENPDKVKEEYPNCYRDILNFFEGYLEEFNKELEKEKQEYIEYEVKKALEEEKAEIEKQAFEEYFSDSEEE